MKYAGVMDAWKDYAPRDNKYVEAKIKLVNNVENFYKGREKIMEGFKNGVFPFYYNETHEYQMKAQGEIEEEEIEEERRRWREKKEKQKEEQKEESEEDKFFKYIENESEDINYLLFKYYFNFIKPSDLAKKLFEIKDKKEK